MLWCEFKRVFCLLQIKLTEKCTEQIVIEAVNINRSPLHCSSLNRSLCRGHVAECAGRVELLQTAVGDWRAGWTGQRADDADVRHSLHAAAPPGPPVCSAAAVRQTAELRQQRRGHVELRRTLLGLLPGSFPAAWNEDGLLCWMHTLQSTYNLRAKFEGNF